MAYFHGSSLTELIWNSGSTLCFANAAVIRSTFDFLQAAARSVEEARRMPFCEESEELMQSTDNEEHKSGKRPDLPLRVGGAHVEPRAWCQLLGNSGVTRLLALQRQGRSQSARAFGPDREFMNHKQTAQSLKCIPCRNESACVDQFFSEEALPVSRVCLPESLHSRMRAHPDALSESGPRLGDARARRSSEN